MKRSHSAVLLLVIILIVLSFLAGRHTSINKGIERTSQRRVLYYVDPMHPAYKSDKPGIAPDCGMQLEPVYADGEGAAADRVADLSSMQPGSVSINAEQQQLIGLRVASVETSSGTRNVRLLGRVVVDEERAYRLTAGTDGYIENTFPNPVGARVKKDERLATFRAPEFLVAEQSYLTAVLQSPMTKVERLNEVDWRSQTAKLAYGRLRAMGMSSVQLKHILETNQIEDSIDIVSPVDGFVVTRSVSPGQRFEKGGEFYRVADFSHVVILADVFENEARSLRPGAIATVTLPNNDKKIRATVSKVLPQFDATTRTMKIRLEVDNPGFLLRPDMFVDVELPVAAPAGLSIPADALLDSGMKKRVFIDRGNGLFEPREVVAAMRVGDQVQIVKGLTAGDRIVVSGTFLVDSESRLKATAASAPADSAAPAKTERQASKPKASDKPASSKSSQTQSAADDSAQTKDPRCGMESIRPKRMSAGLTANHKGTTYYFCSKGCKEEFLANPEKYAGVRPRGRDT